MVEICQNQCSTRAILLPRLFQAGRYQDMRLKELIQECKRLNVRGYSNRRKQDILILLQQQQNTTTETFSAPPKDNVLALFYHSCQRRENDHTNKLYDFAVLVQKNLFTQHILKIEFKYGKSLFDYPQFISLYLTNRHFSLTRHDNDYISFWYQYFLPKYMACAHLPDDIPSLDGYRRTINSTTYNTNIQRQLYDIMKTDPQTQNQLYGIVDQSIEQYLSGLTLEDIDFEAIEKMVRKQIEKLFIFCKNGTLSCYSFVQFTTDKTRYEVNKNTLMVFDTENKFVLKFLLRWKNYKGLSGPAWQVGIKKMI